MSTPQPKPERIYIPDPSIVGPNEPPFWSANPVFIRKYVEYIRADLARNEALEDKLREFARWLWEQATEEKSPDGYKRTAEEVVDAFLAEKT